jgi:hypothetical protein
MRWTGCAGLVEEYPDRAVDALLAELLTSSEQEAQ